MAATAVTATKSTRVTSSPASPVSGALAASDATEGNSFTNTGREILVVSTGTTATRTITFYDAAGTAVGTASSVVKEKIFVFGPFDRYNYGSTVTFKTSNTDVKVAVITLDEAKSYGSNR